MNLLLGDCLQVLPTLPEGSCDLVVTSPPYNLGINYKSFKDTAPREEFLAWCREWAAEVKRVMTDDASFFLNVGAAPANPLLPHQLILALTDGSDPLFTLQNTFHWIKSISIETRAGEHSSPGSGRDTRGAAGDRDTAGARADSARRVSLVRRRA